MKKYSSYKPIPFEWMGEIPSHWVITKNRYGFRKWKNGSNDSEDTNVLSLTIKGIKIKTYLSFGKSTESYIGHQLVKKGDIVFTPRDFDQTPILSDVSKFDGCISNLYIVDKTKDGVLNHYVNYYWYGLKYSVNYFKNFSHGMRFSFNRFQFDEIPLLVPPLPEQQQIVSFLVTKIQKIEELIEKTEMKVELLKEKRTSLINHCVTKGLNPKVEMKDSGVEWIGEIPKEWKSSKLKYNGEFFSGYSFDSGDFEREGEVRVIKISNIQNNGISWEDLSFVPNEYYDKYEGFRVIKGDLVFVLTRPIISTGIKVCFYEEDYLTLLNQRNSVYRSDKNLLVKRFLFYIVRTFYFSEEFKQQLKETIIPAI